jgi:hypothetical protein
LKSFIDSLNQKKEFPNDKLAEKLISKEVWCQPGNILNIKFIITLTLALMFTMVCVSVFN